MCFHYPQIKIKHWENLRILFAESCEFYIVTLMLVACKLKNFDVSPFQNLKFDWKATLSVIESRPRMLSWNQNFLLCDCPTLVPSHLFSQNYMVFFENQNKVVGKRNGKNNSSESSVNLKLPGLPRCENLSPSQSGRSLKSGRSLIHNNNFNGNQISTWWAFQRST